MNNQLRCFYVAILDNEVVCFDTTVAVFRKEFVKIEPKIFNYRTLLRKFDTPSAKFTLTLSGKEYHFQKLI
jgi:hypothetical protein